MKDKKVVIVTGASKGIGRAAAALFAAKGHIVYALSRSGCDLQGVHSVLCDVTDGARLREAIDGIANAENRIDVLVSNAGAGIAGAAEKTDTATAKSLFELNFFALFEAAKCVIPHMRAAGGGHIVNVGSVAGALHLPFQAFYSASKAAVEAFGNALRGELKPFKIKVSAILPGDTRTHFTEAREKDFLPDDPDYGKRISRSISRMEHDERRGMPPEKVARKILKAARKKNPKPTYTVGAQYKFFLFLGKLLPRRWIQALINRLYAK